MLENLLACLKLLDPLFSNTLNLPTKPIFFKPKYQFCYFFTIYFFYKFNKNKLYNLALTLNRFEYPIKLLGQCFEDWGLFSKSLTILLNKMSHFNCINI